MIGNIYYVASPSLPVLYYIEISVEREREVVLSVRLDVDIFQGVGHCQSCCDDQTIILGPSLTELTDYNGLVLYLQLQL